MQRLHNILLKLIFFVIFFILFYYYVPYHSKYIANPSRRHNVQRHEAKSVPAASVYVWCIVVKVEDSSSALLQKFLVFLQSMLQHSKCRISLSIITDRNSKHYVDDAIRQSQEQVKTKLYEIKYYSVEGVSKKIKSITRVMKPHFSSVPDSYYSDSLFYMSLGLYEIAPEHQREVILLDVDMKFRGDIEDLQQFFTKFGSKTLFALAPELTPVYHHILWKWKEANENSDFGEPSWRGYSGLNSGVVLLNLERMRNSQEYEELLSESYVDKLTKKYMFEGHLGDQDYYTLLAKEKPHLVNILPCSWNRQLCQWWKHHGYLESFDEFARCDEPVQIYHGNCNTSIPDH